MRRVERGAADAEELHPARRDEAAARLHVARTICRRAERDALAADEENGINPLVLAYLNRLSDFLFIAARSANAAAGQDEPLWLPGGTSDRFLTTGSFGGCSNRWMTLASVEGGVDRGNATAAPARSAAIPRGGDASATIFTVGKTACRSRTRLIRTVDVEDDHPDVALRLAAASKVGSMPAAASSFALRGSPALRSAPSRRAAAVGRASCASPRSRSSCPELAQPATARRCCRRT